MNFEKRVQVISIKLNTFNIQHEVLGDNFMFAFSPTCTIHTNNCTIEVYKNQITVNEKPVSDLDEMVDKVLVVEKTYSSVLP